MEFKFILSQLTAIRWIELKILFAFSHVFTAEIFQLFIDCIVDTEHISKVT